MKIDKMSRELRYCRNVITGFFNLIKLDQSYFFFVVEKMIIIWDDRLLKAQML